MITEYTDIHKKPNSIVYNMDNMNFMKQVPDGYYDLAVVDPPYGINVNMNAGRKTNTQSKKRELKKWDNSTPTEQYFIELKRVSLVQIIWGANHMIDKIKSNSQGWIFWDKCVAEGCSFSDGELAWTSLDQALKKAIIPWSGFIGYEGAKFHPTTKPIALYDWIYKNYLPKGGRVIDTHLGSGSNRISAHKRGNIIFDAMELDADYFNYSNKRFDDFLMKYEPAEQQPITATGQVKLF